MRNGILYLLLGFQFISSCMKEKTYEKLDELKMISIQGKWFRMGDFIGEGLSEERPIHWVKVNSFYISQTEINQTQYEIIMGENPSYYRGAKRPVDNIQWADAVEFCNRLSEYEGFKPVYSIVDSEIVWDSTKNGYRLPTEAEWELACRNIDTTNFHCGNDTVVLKSYAWYKSNSNSTTHDVGLLVPNFEGLFDMHGNVFEWCWDWYGTYNSDSLINPRGPRNGTEKILKGGSFNHIAWWSRTSLRGANAPHHANPAIGMRIVRNK